MNSLLSRMMSRVPAAFAPWVASAVSIFLGMLVAVVIHYLLYRVGLPSKPFIYVAF